jgi:hypothetical protein
VAAAAALVVILALPTSAATFRIEVTPPYAGLSSEIDSQAYTQGCRSAASFSVPAFVDNATGRVGSSSKSVAANCSGESYPFLASTAASITFSGLNFTVPVSGVYRVAYVWRFSFNASLSVRGEGNKATVDILTYDFLYVPSNGSYADIGSGPALFHEIESGTYRNDTRGATDVFQARLFLEAGVVYEVLTALVWGTSSVVNAPGRAVSDLDFARNGLGGQLRSITVESS